MKFNSVLLSLNVFVSQKHWKQIRVRPQDESRSYPAVSAAYLLFRRKDYNTWRRVKNTDELYFWHRGTTLLV